MSPLTFGEASLRPVLRWIRDPIWKLIRPDEVVAANQLAARLGKVDEIVSASEVEYVLLWFCVLELDRSQSMWMCCIETSTHLHDVRWCSFAKVMSIVEFFHIILVARLVSWNVCCGPEPKLACLLCCIVEAELSCGCGYDRSRWTGLRWCRCSSCSLVDQR